LEEIGGFDPNSADLVIGTSAGSVIGAYLRAGWTTRDFWDLAMGTHSMLGGLSAEEMDAIRAEMYTPNFRSMPELARRVLGSLFVMSRSVWRMPGPLARPVPPWLGRLFPGGMFRMAEGVRRFNEDLPASWPPAALWICAVDIVSGRRVVLGRPGSVRTSLAQAVMASCAIPGFYTPVRVAGVTLVDGGAHSTTNLDLAARAGCETIVCLAPMAYDTASPPTPPERVLRSFAQGRLDAEAALARRKGARLLLLRPTRREVRLHGLNLMRRRRWEDVARAAYEETARLLATPTFRKALSELSAA